MSKQTKGEHSRDNDPNEDEKPFKKARYVWEVKGKYHLKDTYKNNRSNENNINNPSSSSATSEHVDEGSKTKKTSTKSKFSNKEAQGASECCIKSILEKTEAIMDVIDDEDASYIDSNISNEIPVTLVPPKPKNQEYYLRKWQARQIARGFVDNTINSVLESWAHPPLIASDFVDICDNDGQVEDDAILMAIQSHGLQSNLRENVHFPNIAYEQEIAFVHSLIIEESNQDNIENIQNELFKEQRNVTASSDEDADTMCCDSSISNHAEDGDLNMGDPMDFLNAAVSVAIQKKGLSYGY